jgi:hypothetical protein
VTDLFAADLKRILWRPMTRAIGGFGVAGLYLPLLWARPFSFAPLTNNSQQARH